MVLPVVMSNRRKQRMEIGRMSKRVLDACRMQWVAARYPAFDFHMSCYCDVDKSPENVLIVGRPRGSAVTGAAAPTPAVASSTAVAAATTTT